MKEIISCPNFETNSPKQYCTRLTIDNSVGNPQVDNRVLSVCQNSEAAVRIKIKHF